MRGVILFLKSLRGLEPSSKLWYPFERGQATYAASFEHGEVES